MLRAVCLMNFFSLAIVLATVGIYLRSWVLQFKIKDLQDYATISNQPDDSCEGAEEGEWRWAAQEGFMECDARQREDFTRADKEKYDVCLETHRYSVGKYCQRGTE